MTGFPGHILESVIYYRVSYVCHPEYALQIFGVRSFLLTFEDVFYAFVAWRFPTIAIPDVSGNAPPFCQQIGQPCADKKPIHLTPSRGQRKTSSLSDKFMSNN